MPFNALIPAGRTTYYLRGTVKAGKKSRSVYESTGAGSRQSGVVARAEEIRLRRESEIYAEMLYGAQAVATFTEAAAGYCEDRQRRRIARNAALIGQPDKEAKYVAKCVKFLRKRQVADVPLVDYLPDSKRHLAKYFDELHIAKGTSWQLCRWRPMYTSPS
jgi:hypothetical protein